MTLLFLKIICGIAHTIASEVVFKKSNRSKSYT